MKLTTAIAERSKEDLGPHPDFPSSRVIHDRAMGFYRTEPYPSEMDLGTFYSGEYRVIREESPTENYVAFMKHRAAEQSRFIMKNLPIPKLACVIDVGCGCGELLSALQPHTEKCIGFETDPMMARYAEENKSSPTTTIQNEHFKSGSVERCCDLLMMSHVFEHIPHPSEFLEDLRLNTLIAGGFLFIEVPNDPLYWVEDQLLRSHKGLGHLNYFTPASIASTIERAGFEVIQTRTCGISIPEHIKATKPSVISRIMRKLRAAPSKNPTLLPSYASSRPGEDGIYLQAIAVAK